jgi:hypothetical protein
MIATQTNLAQDSLTSMKFRVSADTPHYLIVGVLEEWLEYAASLANFDCNMSLINPKNIAGASLYGVDGVILDISQKSLSDVSNPDLANFLEQANRMYGVPVVLYSQRSVDEIQLSHGLEAKTHYSFLVNKSVCD